MGRPSVKLEEALELVNRAVEDPENPAYLDSLGWVHYRLGAMDQAEYWLRRANELSDEDGTLLAHLGEVLVAAGDIDEGSRLLRLALDLGCEDPDRVRRCLTVSVMPPPITESGSAPLRCPGVTVVAHTGCASSQSDSAATMEELADAVALLVRPLPGDFAALYDLRVARSGGLRLAVVTAGDGRMTISEPFGGAVSLSAWTAGGSSMFFDMDQGCRREVDDLEEVLGVAPFP